MLHNIDARYAHTCDAGDNLVTKVEPFKDDFNDGDYTGWTVSTGTWDASNHYLTCSTSLGGIYKSYSYSSSADADLWFSYYDGDTSGTSYYMKVYLRDSFDNVRLEIYSNQMALKEYDYSAGTTTTLATSNATSAQNTWYDVYVRCDGANIQVYRAQRGSGSEMTQVLSTSSSAVNASGFLRLMTYGSFRFEDLRMASDVMSATTTYAYNTADELTSSAVGGASTSYSYDYWGRMLTKNQQSGAHTATYGYRYDSKLCTVTSSIPDESNVTNQYDGAGKLRSITTGGATKKLRWDAGFHPINLEDANGNLTTTFVHDPDREAAGSVLAAHVGSDPASGGTWAYLSQDHLGSTRHLRGQDRASLGTYEYTPYGDPYIATGMDLPQKFTGHWQIPQAGLYYAPYRMYSPSAARWLSRDPLGMVDGPNVYGYAESNPTDGGDPLGLVKSPGCEDRARNVLYDIEDTLASMDAYTFTADKVYGNKKKGKVKTFTVTVHGDTSTTVGSTTVKHGGALMALPFIVGYSIDIKKIRIRKSACALGDDKFKCLVAHEAGHAIRDFSRAKYMFSGMFGGDFWKSEEDLADTFARGLYGCPSSNDRPFVE